MIAVIQKTENNYTVDIKASETAPPGFHYEVWFAGPISHTASPENHWIWDKKEVGNNTCCLYTNGFTGKNLYIMKFEDGEFHAITFQLDDIIIKEDT